MTIHMLPVTALLLDKGIQTRQVLYDENIQEYAALYQEHGHTALPPILVMRGSKGQLWVVDGFHRVRAALLAHMAQLPSEVKTGTYRDAVLLACSHNAGQLHMIPVSSAERHARCLSKHGLPSP